MNQLNETNETMPSPPVLKTTIIQLNKDLDQDDNNYEILTNEYNQNKESTSGMTNISASIAGSIQSKKKRRRSSANVDSDELLKRKNDTKQLHSIIEKRRRIKINREFEALKYLIPACRLTSSGSGPNGKKGAGTNNGSKIDGMYKLTILKSSVEYILYLHHIIQQQHNLIRANDNKYKFDIDFARIPLDVNTYRNINKDFNFKDLITNIEDASSSNSPKDRDSVIEEDYEEDPANEDTNQLLSPDITPDMAPVLSMLNKYTPMPRESDSSSVSPNGGLQTAMSCPTTTDNSPYNNPIRNCNSVSGKFNKFQLPDPALNPTEYDNDETNQYQYGPKRKLFKAKIPPNNTILFNRPLNIKCASSDRIREDKLSDQDASKTLLALRKSSIDSLLN
ncbi:uncharacterized protein AC631_02383 [Debaryomyces fabryi]|uniref:BHLH domain-containing protein n=1 Tax=Debaryomyces fabryi TaxID=58627 RepID=A0A0V1Q0F4_9ASCO|nr:uncharacterized protein AC631_02383 [Debaryomyces fabryi]KSA01850.1 hypothetical protein AC631_02383 [Debaryomyces fabryi]CUM45605.1 unnamed protein product [Debaryomyces fabryi]